MENNFDFENVNPEENQATSLPDEENTASGEKECSENVYIPQNYTPAPQNSFSYQRMNYPPPPPPPAPGFCPPSPPPPLFQPSFEDERRFFEKKAVKKTAGNIGMALLLFTLISTALQFVLMFVMGIFQLDFALMENDAFLLALNMVITVICYPISVLYITGREKRKIDKMVSFGKPKKGVFLSSLMIGMGMCYVANIVNSVVYSILPEFLKQDSQLDLPEGGLGFVFSVISVAVFAALLEELVFRGAIMGSLLKFGKPFAIVVSSLLFALFHGNMEQIPFAFLVGLGLAFVVIETNSIWTGILIHFLNNFISVCLDYLGVLAGEEIQTAVYVLLLAVMIFIGFLGVYLHSKKNKNFLKYPGTEHISSGSQRFGWFCSAPTVIIFFVIIGLEIGLLGSIA